jgi:hypothetical protein
MNKVETIESKATGGGGALHRIQRASVPGGWIYIFREWERRPDMMPSITPRDTVDCYRVVGITSAFVPDPTAPHCQPTPPADDRPPMTDEALEAWLTATYGEPRVDSDTQLAWGPPGRPIVYHDTTNETDAWDLWLHCANSTRTGYSIPAHVAGPALWAAHRYGAP